MHVHRCWRVPVFWFASCGTVCQRWTQHCRGGPQSNLVYNVVCRKFDRRVIFTPRHIVIKCNCYEARQISLLFFAFVFVCSLILTAEKRSTASSSFWTRQQANSLLAELQRPLFLAIQADGRKKGLFFSHPLNTREKRFLLAGKTLTGNRNVPLLYYGTICGPKSNTIRSF